MKSKLLSSLVALIPFLSFSFGGLKLEDASASLLQFIREPFDQNLVKSILKSSQVSVDCSNAFDDLYATENKNNSRQFFDSWSSLPSGLLAGQTVSFGSIEECQAATLKSNHSDEIIRGKYTTLVAWILSNHREINKKQGTELFSFGVCLPSPCKLFDVQQLFSNYFNTTKKVLHLFGLASKDEEIGKGRTIFSVYNNEEDISNQDFIAANIGIVVFGFISILVVCSSLYELIWTKFDIPINPLWKSFSVLSNGKYLFQIHPRNTMSPNMIECLNGIRALSLIWNVYGHTYLWIYHRPDMNKHLIAKTFQGTYISILMAAHLSVDSFLLLSGLLITWTGLNRMNKRNGKINVKLTYLHRYLRLTPSYAATILFAAGLYVFLGTGPYWYSRTLSLSKQCQKYWWRGLFYIANYFPFNEMCMGHSWFLAVDMQLFFISPIILMGFWKWPKKMCSIVILLACLSRFLVFLEIVGVGAQSFEMDVNSIMEISAFDRAHFRTELSAAPWLVGVLLGYLLFQQRHRKGKLSMLKLSFIWFLWLTIMMAILFVPIVFVQQNIRPNPFQSALYESLGHFGWALNLSWIIYSSYMGYSELINSFLSHPIWQIVAKLNYTIYLVKTFMNINNLSLQKTRTDYTHYTMIAEFWADFGISSCFAVLLSLMVELPFMALENHFLSSWMHY